MKLIIKTEFADLFRFFCGYPELDYLPHNTPFFMERNLRLSEVTALSQYTNCVVVTNTFYDQEMKEAEILSFIKSERKFRKTACYTEMDRDEFCLRAKLYWVCGIWEVESEEGSFFDLYKSLTTPHWYAEGTYGYRR